jgi:hypothetical protein
MRKGLAFIQGRVCRSTERPLVRGLNRNYNWALKPLQWEYKDEAASGTQMATVPMREHWRRKSGFSGSRQRHGKDDWICWKIRTFRGAGAANSSWDLLLELA